MRAKPLALAIASLYAVDDHYFVSTAPVKSLWDPRAPLEHGRIEEEVKWIVSDILIDETHVELYPRIVLMQGVVVRHFETPGYSHTFSVTTDFKSGNVTSKLKSWEHSTNEEVFIQGQWRVDRHVTTKRTPRSKRHV